MEEGGGWDWEDRREGGWDCDVKWINYLLMKKQNNLKNMEPWGKHWLKCVCENVVWVWGVFTSWEELLGRGTEKEPRRWTDFSSENWDRWFSFPLWHENFMSLGLWTPRLIPSSSLRFLGFITWIESYINVFLKPFNLSFQPVHSSIKGFSATVISWASSPNKSLRIFFILGND